MEWLGLVLAFSGLIYLVFPGLSAPPFTYSILMMSAGIAWGFYTLRGKGGENPLADTTGNFLRTVPMIFVIGLIFLSNVQISSKGIIFAILSGAIASGSRKSFFSDSLSKQLDLRRNSYRNYRKAKIVTKKHKRNFYVSCAFLWLFLLKLSNK